MKNSFFVVWFLSSSVLAWSNCQVFTSQGRPAAANADFVFGTLTAQASCPKDVREFKAALAQENLTTRPAMVGNRGFHNPSQGSFSFFEEVSGSLQLPQGKFTLAPGHFFFGHFTEATDDQKVQLAQEPENGLMIELIAWDFVQDHYNFYELIGSQNGSTQWFYRGNSKDIFADNQKLYLSSPVQFGSGLRCSGCHASGGPIMKEQSLPHNDWWARDRILPFGPNAPDAEISSQYIPRLVDSEEFAKSVRAGIANLATSEKFQKFLAAQSLKIQLRPLFCDVEVNLESDTVPLDTPAERVQIPSKFFVPEFFGAFDFSIKKSDYESLLVAFATKFREYDRRDADYAWLTPVKSHSDEVAIENLIAHHVIDQEFAADVLAVDLEHPLFSSDRCSLLRLLPDSADDWQTNFRANLAAQAGDAAAQSLLNNLTDPAKNLQAYKKSATALAADFNRQLATPDGQKKLFHALLDRRQSVFDADISKNRRGQIFEPDFRVIFPEAH